MNNEGANAFLGRVLQKGSEMRRVCSENSALSRKFTALSLAAFAISFCRVWAWKTGLQDTALTKVSQCFEAFQSMLPPKSGNGPEAVAERVAAVQRALAEFDAARALSSYASEFEPLEPIVRILLVSVGNDYAGREMELWFVLRLHSKLMGEDYTADGDGHVLQSDDDRDRLEAILKREKGTSEVIDAMLLMYFVVRLRPFRRGNMRLAKALFGIKLVSSGLGCYVRLDTSGPRQKAEFDRAVAAMDSGDLTPLVMLTGEAVLLAVSNKITFIARSQ